jgi:signal peptidase I
LIFATRLKKPRHFRLIGFRPPPADRSPSFLVQRLCGLPGDTVQIKGGTLYVNGRSADDNLPLSHVFKINRENIGRVRYNPKLSYTIPPYSDVLYVLLNDRFAQGLNMYCERHLLPPGLRDNAVFNIYRQNWNLDNFGPVKVPNGCWFVLDDNRSNAADSRQFGFIQSSKFIGAIL